MSDTRPEPPASLYSASRRTFLTGAAASATALMASGNFAHAAAPETLRIGLIGCGGRGTGAALDTCTANEGVQIVALADAFKDQIDNSLRDMKTEMEKRKLNVGEKVKDKPKTYVGLDAYKQLLADKSVDMVILATPPAFRPAHFAAAIDAGKHVFMEKPGAVDAPGIRTLLAAGEMAAQKKLGVAVGTQRRHQFPYVETIKKIHEGAIGDIVAAQCYWNMGYLWHKTRQPGQSDTEWQIRNWNYFLWLSGDHYVEQHVHNLDVLNWTLGAHPKSAYGMGGRQARLDPVYGHIFDHFAVEYEYELPGGRTVLTWSMARQQENTDGNVSERVVGTKGTADPSGSIRGAERYRYQGPNPNPYEQEHRDLIASIRAGTPINEAKNLAESTLTAIMGRMSAYSGKRITWEQALNSNESLTPARLDLGAEMSVPPVPIPGKYEMQLLEWKRSRPDRATVRKP